MCMLQYYIGGGRHFSLQCKQTPLRSHCHLVVEMQTLHSHSKQLGRSGLGLVTLLQTKHAHEHFEYNT